MHEHYTSPLHQHHHHRCVQALLHKGAFVAAGAGGRYMPTIQPTTNTTLDTTTTTLSSSGLVGILLHINHPSTPKSHINIAAYI